MCYNLVEHRHRLAAWAASRAAATSRLCRFRVEAGVGLINALGLRAYAEDWNALPEPQDFDGVHRRWRSDLVQRAGENINQFGGHFSHGVAAKLINCYLKVAVICAFYGEYEVLPEVVRFKINAIHPPIDRIILRGLAEHDQARRQCWLDFAAVGWSNFSSEQYESVIFAAHAAANGAPLWTLERHWVGHQ